MINGQDAMRNRHDDLHDMFDDDDGHSPTIDLLDQFDGLHYFFRSESGRGFIQQQQFGLGGQGPGDLQPFAHPDRQSLAC